MNANHQVARTILEQMGGMNRLRAMINAKDFVADETWVQFGFSGSRKANKCRVVLDEASDTYNFELWKWNSRKMELTEVYKLEGVYWDMLVELFEGQTGLYLSL